MPFCKITDVSIFPGTGDLVGGAVSDGSVGVSVGTEVGIDEGVVSSSARVGDGEGSSIVGAGLGAGGSTGSVEGVVQAPSVINTIAKASNGFFSFI